MVAPPPLTRSPKGRGKKEERGENIEPKERALKAKGGKKKMRDAMAHKVCGAVREGGKLHISEDPLFPLSYVACFKDNSLFFFFFAKGLCNVRATLPRQRDYTNVPHEEDKTHKQTHPICATLKRNVQRQNGKRKRENGQQASLAFHVRRQRKCGTRSLSLRPKQSDQTNHYLCQVGCVSTLEASAKTKGNAAKNSNRNTAGLRRLSAACFS